MFRHAARRQPNTCCEQTCQRRATSDTRAPGTRLSSTIRAFSAADQRRRRPGPTSTSTRRYSPFASSLTSNITIARCPLSQATQPPSGRVSKKGNRAPLTVGRREAALHQGAYRLRYHIQPSVRLRSQRPELVRRQSRFASFVFQPLDACRAIGLIQPPMLWAPSRRQ